MFLYILFFFIFLVILVVVSASAVDCPERLVSILNIDWDIKNWLLLLTVVGTNLVKHFMDTEQSELLITFRVSHRQREMYCGHVRLYVCVSVWLCVCLSAAACLHYYTDPDVTWESGKGCPLVVHYWADLQSVHGLHWYGNTRNAWQSRVPPPPSSIDIIGAMVIVWRVGGKIIRSVLCNIVCNSYAHMNRLTDLWIGFCLTGPISLCLDSLLYFVYHCILHACVGL